MADVSLLGADYPGVPAVQLPRTGGGTVMFYENTVTSGSLTIKQGSATGNVNYDKTLSVGIIHLDITMSTSGNVEIVEAQSTCKPARYVYGTIVSPTGTARLAEIRPSGKITVYGATNGTSYAGELVFTLG